MRMRISSGSKPLNSTTARNCFLVNQCATPGLGSLMAGRRLAGIGQLLVAVAGFALVIGWFVLNSIQTYNQVVNDAEPKSVAGLGLAGAAVFIAAWLWSLVTSLSVLREARANERKLVTPPLSDWSWEWCCLPQAPWRRRRALSLMTRCMSKK